MIEELARAIEKIKALPPERQADAADALERIAEAARVPLPLTPEERALIEEGLADLDAGRVVPDAEMAAFWDRHRT